MREIRGAVAVITGAGSGMGRALAQQLASRGALVALADVDPDGLTETRRLVGAAAQTYRVDVSDSAAVEGFANQVQKDFGRASLLVNNAGVALRGTFAQVSLADMQWLMNINFWGVVYGCKAFQSMLLREPDAHIVNLSSVFGLMGVPGQSAYCASKFAVRGFTEVLRHELKASHVNVTCVHPGGVSTSIAANSRSSAGVESSAAEAALRFEKLARTTPETAARVIVNGILQNKTRVIIGSDALRIDVLQRLMPVRGSALVASSLEGKPLAPLVAETETANR
jgi:NAD(P)-dependent dehydrogenase (short-subunit alcohol dehydrogenase family)